MGKVKTMNDDPFVPLNLEGIGKKFAQRCAELQSKFEKPSVRESFHERLTDRLDRLLSEIEFYSPNHRKELAESNRRADELLGIAVAGSNPSVIDSTVNRKFKVRNGNSSSSKKKKV